MLIFLKFVDETKMPKPQEYQKVVFSWPQRSSKYIKSSRKTLYAGAVATSSSSKDSFVIIIIRLVSSSYFSRKICLSLSTIASLALSSNNIKNIVMTNLDVNRLRRCCSNQLQSQPRHYHHQSSLQLLLWQKNMSESVRHSQHPSYTELIEFNCLFLFSFCCVLIFALKRQDLVPDYN